MDGYNGDYAVTLPSLAPSPGSAMQEQQRFQFQKQLREDQLRSQKQARRLQLINSIEARTDPAKFLIGESTIDQHTTGQLQDIQNKMLRTLKDNPDMDPADLELQVNQAVTPVAIAHAKMKAISQDIDANLKLAKGDLPVLNDAKLRDLARKAAFLKYDQNGNMVYKDPEEMNSGANYVQNIINNSPESVVDNDAALVRHIQNFKTNDVSAKMGSQYAGVKVKNGYSAKLSPFRELNISPDGTVKGLKYKSEDIHLPNGNTLQVLPEDLFNVATADPNARLSFYKLWNQNKSMYGGAGLPNDDPTSRVLQRKFLLDYLQHTNVDHSYFMYNRDQSNDKTVNDIQMGLGTPLDRSLALEREKQANREKNIATHQSNTEHNIKVRADLKNKKTAIPGF